jgi:hypothetical protein
LEGRAEQRVEERCVGEKERREEVAKKDERWYPAPAPA